jgi:hypothetical protein
MQVQSRTRGGIQKPERAYIVTVAGVEKPLLVYAKNDPTACAKAAERLRKKGIYVPLGDSRYRAVLRTPTPAAGGWRTIMAYRDFDSR